MAVQKITMDMSGRGGLGYKWFGDMNKHGYTGDTEVGAPNLRYLAKDGQTVNGIYNPVTKYGYMSPSANTYLTPAVNGTAIDQTIPINLVDETNHFLYFNCNNGHLYLAQNFYKDEVDDIVTVGSGVSDTLITWTDAAKYQLNGGAKLYFAWASITQSYISTYDSGDPTGLSWNENWSKTDVANGNGGTGVTFGIQRNLRMIPSGDSFMYILDGIYVHRFDGTIIGGSQGTIYQNVLQGQAGTIFTMGAEWKNKLYLAIRKSSTIDDYDGAHFPENLSSAQDTIGIFVWNKQSSFFNSSDFVQLPGAVDIRAIWVSPKGDLRVMTLEATGEVYLRIFDGTKFTIYTTLPYGAAPSTIKSLKVHGMYTYWMGLDGLIYAHGSDIPGESDFLWIAGQYETDGEGYVYSSSLACVMTPSGDLPLAGNKPTDVFWLGYSKTGTDGYLKTFYPFSSNTINNI